MQVQSNNHTSYMVWKLHNSIGVQDSAFWENRSFVLQKNLFLREHSMYLNIYLSKLTFRSQALMLTYAMYWCDICLRHQMMKLNMHNGTWGCKQSIYWRILQTSIFKSFWLLLHKLNSEIANYSKII